MSDQEKTPQESDEAKEQEKKEADVEAHKRVAEADEQDVEAHRRVAGKHQL